ncbi:hypothetical protein CDD83_8568 [Cordyceps sp. RAO-2017]|nr:hypothetical protein CDD83_8568 [Cordyceps sp. RAO-2017]
MGHLRSWIKYLRLDWGRYKSADTNTDPQSSLEFGLSFYDRKNPDHLPPANLFERVGDYICQAGSILRTSHAGFGLRGACAVMTILILSFLHDSQEFFFRQRFLWALFAMLLSMAPSYIIWYIVDQKTAGILVFLAVWFAVLGYLSTKFPQLNSAWMVATIAAIVMVANELQVRKLGKATVEMDGQVVYAPYIIFPYRLAIVSLGVCTAYFWTIFPYPLSEHTELRNEVAKSMYLLANYSMCIRQTILSHLQKTSGDVNDKTSPGYHLQTVRRRIFRQYQTLSTSAKGYFKSVDWEFSLGGRFPKETYGEIFSVLERLASYMTLTGYLDCI